MSREGIEKFKCILALILIVIYIGTVFFFIKEIYFVENPDPDKVIESNGFLWWLLMLTGSLLSTLVISTLAITDISKGKIHFSFLVNVSKGKSFIEVVTWIYLIVWLVAGISFFLVAVIKPDVCTAFNDFAKAFIGLLIGAVASLFGIKPPSSGGTD